MTELSIVRPKGFSHWLKLYRLYKSAFPASERKPFSIIVNMYHKGRSDVWCIESGGKFAGLAMTINGESLVLLDYFAVDQTRRGEGIGSAALGQLQKIYGGKGLIVEIESTLEPADNRDERLRRKRFYLSNGMRELNVTPILFGVKMELLGSGCQLDFEGYQAFYRDHYSPWAAKNVVNADVCE